MKYIEWLKEQIKLTQYKNIIRFPVEKRLNKIQEEEKIKKKRKGVHSKCKTSNIKTSKHYVKKYKGQGK